MSQLTKEKKTLANGTYASKSNSKWIMDLLNIGGVHFLCFSQS